MKTSNNVEQLEIIKKEAENKILQLLPKDMGIDSETKHIRASIKALAILNGNMAINNKLLLDQLTIMNNKD